MQLYMGHMQRNFVALEQRGEEQDPQGRQEVSSEQRCNSIPQAQQARGNH